MLIFAAIITVVSLTANAQTRRAHYRKYSQYGRTQSPFVRLGFEASLSSPQFTLKSDIPVLQDLKVVEEGFSGGLVIGVRGVDFRVASGSFNSTAMTTQRLDLSTFDAGFTVYPAQLFSPKVRFIEPFFSTSIGQHSLDVYGDYILKPRAPKGAGAGAGQHQCMPVEAPPADPGAPVEEEVIHEETPAPQLEALTETKKLGTIKITRATITAGVTIHILAKKTFLDFFAEYRYGMALKAISTELLFEHTSSAPMHSANIGVVLGLRKMTGR